jgi:hypothetical protein
LVGHRNRLLDAYSCRSVDNIPGEKLSEHAGNAIDIAGFKLADGRTVTVSAISVVELRASGFPHGTLPPARARSARPLTAPRRPFHADFAHHCGGTSYCNPTPDAVPPQRPGYDGTWVAVPLLPSAPFPAGFAAARPVRGAAWLIRRFPRHSRLPSPAPTGPVVAAFAASPTVLSRRRVGDVVSRRRRHTAPPVGSAGWCRGSVTTSAGRLLSVALILSAKMAKADGGDFDEVSAFRTRFAVPASARL